jgi:hypothetical protein
LALLFTTFVPVSVFADTIPVITQQPASVTLAVTGDLSLSVSATGATSFTYQWYKGGVPIFGQTSSGFFRIVQPSDAGQYTVKVTDQAGSTMSAAANVVVPIPALPKPSTQTSRIQTIAAGTPLGVNSVYDFFQSQPLVIEWYKDGQLIQGVTGGQYSVPSAQYSDAGTYVEVDGFLGGSIAQPPVPIEVSTPTSPNTWLDAGSYGGIAYFLFSSPAEVLRYNMNTGAWLAPVSLDQTSAPTAMEVLPEGVYIAFGRTTYLYSLDLGSSAGITNTDVNTFHIFSNSTYLYLVGNAPSYSGEAVYTSVTRSNGAYANYSSPFASVYGGTEASSATGLAYGWSYSDASTLYALTLNSDGTVTGYTGSSLSQVSIPSYTGANVIITPDGSSVVTTSGNVYAAATLNFEASLGLGIADICFLADGSSVALRGNKLTLYGSSGYLEKGSVLLSTGAQRVFGDGSNAFAFDAPSTPGGSISVSEVTEAQLVAGARVPLPSLSASESAAVTPAPDDAFVGTDGIVYLLSRPTGNILRWSTVQDAYLTSIPLTGIPIGFSYSGVLDRIYVSYPDNRVTKIDLGTSTSETLFAATSGYVDCILAADSQLYVVTDGTYWNEAYLYSSNGSITAQETATEADLFPFWNATLQEIEDFAQPGVGEMQRFSIQGGTFGTASFSAFNLEPAPQDPFRFSPNGSLFVAGNGVIYDATALSQSGVLGNSPVDSAWIGSTPYGIIASSAGTELDTWGGSHYLNSGVTQIAGQPLRLWALSAGGLLALTEEPSGPVFNTLDASGNILGQFGGSGTPFQPVEILVNPVDTTVAPGGTVTLSVTATGTDVAYTWVNQFTDAVVGTGSSLVFSNITEAQAGEYSVTVTGIGNTTASESCAVVVTDPPIITLQPSGLDMYTSEYGDMFISASSFPAATYQWNLNGTPIPGAVSDVIGVGEFNPTGAGTYTVTVTNPFGSVTSAPAIVTIGGNLPVSVSITGQPVSRTVEVGGIATFSVTATGDPAPVYQWNFNGVPISGAVSNTLTLAPVTASEAGNYSVSVGNQAGTVTTSNVTLGLAAAANDLNGDGMTDVFWTNTVTNDRGAYLMNGTTVSGWADLGIIPAQWRMAAVADFTGSGHDDILWQNTTTGECGFYMMNGTTVTGWVDLGIIPTAWRIAGAADFTGNGHIDILWQNTTTGECGFYIMNGTAVTGWVDLGIIPTAWRIGAVADFNGDGHPDILWQNTVTGACGFYIMNGTAVSGWVDLGVIPTAWRAVEAGDFNGDGHPDILWQNSSTGEAGIYLMKGTTVTGWAELGTPPAGWKIMP